MDKKILVICNLENDLVTKYQECLEYLPLSNEETDRAWEEILKKYKPKVIIFGLQTINEEKLSLWRKLQPSDTLKFVRKGVSLHRVDFVAAKKYTVEVLNAPGVNAPFVAEFITKLLIDKQTKNGLVGVLGVGHIGKKVVVKLLAAGSQVLVCNRTQYHFNKKNYSYVNDLLELFSKADQIAICLPLTEQTTGIITEQHVQAISQNGQVICISPPRVMSAKAVVALHAREDIDVTFDHVSSGLQFIQEALGHNHLRKNFIFEEKAAASHECQYAMGEAAILKC